MTTIKKIRKEIENVKNLISGVVVELDTIKYKRDEASNTRRNELKTKKNELELRLRELRHQENEMEIKSDRRKLITGYIVSGILFIMFIVGIFVGVVYKYELGLYGLTTNHDVISIINGENPLISVELYNHLFTLNVMSHFLTIFGITGSMISGTVTSLWGLINDKF